MPDASQGVASDGGGQPGTFAVDGGPVRARAGWARCAVAGLLLLLTTLAAAPAHAQLSGICGRTAAVQTAILAEIPNVDDCANVTADHLAAITGSLLLKDQEIAALAAGDFAGLTSLTGLTLRNNLLSTLPAGVFDGLTALTALDLIDNALMTLPAGVFDGLTALTVLGLTNNALTMLPSGVFDGLTALTGLWLDNNALRTLPTGVFDELTALETLTLRNNLLTTLHAEVFDGLTALTALDLHENRRLTTLPAGVFAGLTSLTALNLYDNRLTTLPAGVFAGLTALTALNLHENRLTTLPAGVFAGLTSLTELNLYDNRLTTLPAGVLEPLTALTTLGLSGNPGAPFAPVAVALPDGGLSAGGMVTLDGSSSDGGPWGTNVTYSWALTYPANGVTVTFDDAASATPVVTIPSLPPGTPLTFTLTVTGRGSTGTYSTGVAAGTDTAGDPPSATLLAHCTSPQSNELWCGAMTVGNQSGSPRYGYNRFTGTGSITPDRFTHNGKTFVVNALANNGKPARSLRFVLGRYFDPDYSTNFHECLLSRLGSSRLTLEFGTGGNKKTAPLVVQPGPRIHFDMYPYGGSWSAGDTVQVKLLRVSSPGAPAQSRPVATAVRSTTNPYESIDVSWTAVTTVCGQPVEAYEIQVSEDGTSWRTLVRDTNSTALTYTHSGVPQGATRHYRVQAAVGPYGTGSGSGFGPSASASTTTLPSCGASFPDEIWCAELTVGGNPIAVTGFHQGNFGSLSDGQFDYGGTQYSVPLTNYDVGNGQLVFVVSPTTGHSIFNNAGFRLHLGTHSVSFPAHVIGPGDGFLGWTSGADPGWTPGDRVIVRLTGPASGRQVEVESPTVTSTPEVSEAGSDGQWTEGKTVEVTIAFSEAVEVDTTGGTPSVTIGLSGTETRNAGYLRGGGTADLVFGYTLITGDGAHTVMAVTPDSLALNGGAIRSVATNADAALGHVGTLVRGDAGGAPAGPDARFEGVPESHDGATAFTVELHFNAEPEGLSFRTVAGGLLEVEGGTVTRAARSTPGSNLGWRVTVAPSGAGDVRVRLPARPCGSPNAVCVGGRPLAQAAEATVLGTSSTEPPSEVPLTASYSNVPAEHDGTSPFELRFRLSAAPAGLSYRTVHNGLFDVTGASIGRAWRLRKGNNEGWGIRVEPSGFGDVTLTVRATTDCAGTPGVCMSDGRKLGGGLQATIAGPATLSVADAEVDEDSGAVLDFTVTLSRRLMETVTVEYGTADGSASAGADYTNTSGTLTFAAGETSKTVAVPVLDDELDEGSETLTLTLSNPAPTRVKLADAEATGTISNTGAMPQAWIARFGRTVAEHVLDAVEARREGGAKPGMEASLAGQRIGGAALPEDVAERQEIERSKNLADWLKSGTDPQRRDLGSRTITARDLLTGSSFALTAATQGSGLVSIWGRGAVTRFDGREGDLSVDGEVATGMLGADWTQGAWKTGLLVSHSLGDGGYRGASAGTMTSTLTGIFPWVRHALGKRLSVWGVAGYGEGSLTLEPEDEAKIRTDLDLWMAAAGLRGVLLDGGNDGPTLAAKTDAMIVRTSSDAVSGRGGMAAAEAGVTRLRLGLEGSQRFRVGDGATLTPSVEIGVRHDGGDAETGFGVDIGGGLAWSDSRRGITAAFRGRGLLTHEADGFRERGLSGSLSWDPRPASDRGPRASLAQTLGGSASGGMNALLARDTLTGLAANDNGGDLQRQRLEARFGYGFAAFGDRFTSVPEVAVGLSNAGRDYSLGWRLVRGSAPGGGSLELAVEARRRESANPGSGAGAGSEPEHAVGFRVNARF